MAGRSVEPSAGNNPGRNKSATNKTTDEKLLLLLQKFRNRGGRKAALAAFANLQADGFDVLKDLPSKKHSTCEVRCAHLSPLLL